MRAIRSFQCGVSARRAAIPSISLCAKEPWSSSSLHFRNAHTATGKPTNISPDGVIVKSIFNVPELVHADPNAHAHTRMSLPRFMLSRIATHPQHYTALIDGCNKLSYTYGELHANCFTLAHVLRGLEGLSMGDVIGVMSPNHINYFMTVWAAGLNEYVSTPINHLYTEEEVRFQLKHTRAKVIVAHTVCLERAAKVAAELGIKHVIVIDGDAHPTHHTVSQLINKRRTGLKNQQKQDDDNVFRGTGKPGDGFDSNSNFILPFSSGTTGTPKGVMLSHRNIISNCLQTLVFDGKTLGPDAQGKQQANICPLPYFHIYGEVSPVHFVTVVMPVIGFQAI
jgi:acyl-CoA synthetase (AMP-forming)/AMP-acid ligase II